MKSIRLLMACLSVWGFLGLTQTWAQGTITGTVKDDTGEPVIGATIVVKGTTLGASTDFDGNYTLERVPAGTVMLTATFIGFQPQERTLSLNNGQTLRADFTLSEDTELIDEVVVIGYGVTRKRDLVGSVAKVEQVNEIVGGSFENALQGKAPGVQITQTSGVAGAGSVIRVRGSNSVSSNGDPLIVVDGIPITQDNFLLGEAGGVNNNPLSSINPNDIESVEILKDAAAKAIYGSRGANGVILITTKRGKGVSGKPTFNFSTRLGLVKETNRVRVLNSEEWLGVRQEAWENDGNVGRAPLPNGLTYEDIEGIDTDWYDEVFQTGFQQDYNLSANGKYKGIGYYGGVSYTSAPSYLQGNVFNRLSGRVNLDFNLLKNLKLSVSSTLNRSVTERAAVSFAGGLGEAQTTALPIYGITYDQMIENAYNRGDLARAAQLEAASAATGGYYNLYNNPAARRELQKAHIFEMRTINNASLTYQPIKNLYITAQGNYDFMNVGEYNNEDSLWTTIGDINKANRRRIYNYSGYGVVDYTLPLPEAHNLKVSVGSEYQRTLRQERFEGYVGVSDFLYTDADFANVIDTLDGTRLDFFTPANASTKFLSFFGRVNYIFKDKYMAQFTYRRDGSSVFGSNNRWGDFPAFGVGYIISEENFWGGAKKVFNYLKFKASWGMSGIAGIPGSSQFALYNPNGTYNNQSTFYQTKPANPNLRWETNTMIDVGFEFGMFNDRLTGELALYHAITSDAVIRTRLQASTGFDDLEYYQNIGKIRNMGIEFSLTSRNIVTKTFDWTTRFNVASNQNRVLEVGTATPDALDGGFGDVRAIPGYPMQINYIVPFSHVDQATGRPVYIDINGNETFEYNAVRDRRPAENLLPWAFGSIINEFRYKNFDLSFMFYYSLGGKIYDDAAKRQLGVVTDWNMRADLFDRWQEPGDVARYPQLTMTMLNWGGNDNFWQNNHSLWLEDATFVRLRNLTAGYSIPLTNSKSFKRARVYFVGTNLLTFTPYTGWDPEVGRGRENVQQRNIGGTNVTYLTSPQAKSFIFGVDLTF